MWRLWLGIDLTLFSSWVFDPHLRVVGFWGKPHVDSHQSTISTMNFMPLNSLQTSPKLTLAPAKWTAKSENSNLETSFISRFPWIFSLGLQEKSSPRHSPTKLPTSRVWMWNAVALHRSFHVVCPTKLTWTLEIMLAYGFPKLESRISGDPPFFSSQGQLYLQEWYFWFQVALPKRNGLVKLRGGYFGMP